MHETDFYPEISRKLEREIESCFSDGADAVVCTHNKECASLSEMVADIENKLGGVTDFNKDYVPRLCIGLLVGLKLDKKRIGLCLVEVKYGDNLSLIDYSQLVGYLSVAKHIKAGLLLLVQKRPDNDMLSNDFSTILDLGKLPIKFGLDVFKGDSSSRFNFHSGIIKYVPNNGFEWYNSSKQSGISNFKDLVKAT